jgi:hypothetical protein
VSGLFGGGKKPATPKAPQLSVATATSAADTQAAADSAEERRRRANLASNMLFGNTADSTDPNTNTKKTLLGQ